MYAIQNLSASEVFLDGHGKLSPYATAEVYDLPTNVDRLVLKGIVRVTDLGGSATSRFEVRNPKPYDVYYESGVIPANGRVYVDALTSGLLTRINSGELQVVPPAAGGGVSTEVDPTVTASITDAFGASTGFTGKGAALSVVTTQSLDAVFDKGVSVPGKVTVRTFGGSSAISDGFTGLVPVPTTGDRNKLLSGGGTWVDAGTYTRSTLVATVSGQTIFTLPSAVPAGRMVDFLVNGVSYGPTLITVVGLSLTWNGPFSLETTDLIEVEY